MKESIVIVFSLYSDVSRLIQVYQTHLDHCNFMIDKINGSHSKDYNKDLMEYTTQKHHMEFAIKKLEELQAS